MKNLFLCVAFSLHVCEIALLWKILAQKVFPAQAIVHSMVKFSFTTLSSAIKFRVAPDFMFRVRIVQGWRFMKSMVEDGKSKFLKL